MKLGIWILFDILPSTKRTLKNKKGGESMDMETKVKKVPIKVFDKPKGLIAVPFWVYIKIIGMEFDAIKTSKP